MDETQRLVEKLSAGVIETIRSAAKALTGWKRRRYQAEVAQRYCGGRARRAEQLFGWGRHTVELGLHELRSGIRCLEAFGQRGRKKSEVKSPQLADEVRRIVEPTAQADPKFQTTLAYTRITARRVREELLHSDVVRNDVPCRETVGVMLNRMGYALGRVLKAKPQKRSPRPTRSSHTSPLPEIAPQPMTAACGSRSTPKPR